jgi:hypothetical protein
MGVLTLAKAQNLPLADLIARRAHAMALSAVEGGLSVEICVFDRDGGLVGRAEGDSGG